VALDLFSNFKWVRAVVSCSKTHKNIDQSTMEKAFSGPNLVSRNGDGG